jgi:3-hydroxyethyl bacteriochlorophyllide a dehydrogenase
MHASAVLIEGAKKLSLAEIGLKDPEAGDVVVRVQHSGISTGTEKLLWSGAMPPFPGLAYPLVPGYEAVGEVVDATAGTGHKVGDFVFVPGSSGFREAKGLFGGSASYLVTSADRVRKINPALGDSGTLFALAATARHALAGFDARLPELIIGHGVLGRLLARLTVIAGGKPPTVWEVDENRMAGAQGYQVIHPDQDTKEITNRFTMHRAALICSINGFNAVVAVLKSCWLDFIRSASTLRSPMRLCAK